MAVTPVLTGSVITDSPKVGQPLEVSLSENVPGVTIKLQYGVSDSQGNEWASKSITSDGAVYATVPARPGDLTITCTLLRTYDQKAAEPLVLTAKVAPVRTLIPGQKAGQVVVGMSTDDYAKRLAETGPVGSDHFFIGPGWDSAKFLAGIKTAKSRGLFAYGNMKTGSWSAAAGGSLDKQADQLATDIASLGWPCHICFHHEPGFHSPTDTGEAGTAVDWVNMHNRLAPRMKAIAGDTLTTGCIINGFIMDPRTSGQGWTDAELNQLFTDKFLSSIDSFGGDYYDGATSPTNGQPAAQKIARANSWMEGRGASTCMAVGEFSFVKPADCADLYAVLRNNPDRWWIANAFNSDSNNRSGIPTKGAGWNFTHDFSASKDRLNAFKAVLADSVSNP